MIKVLNGDIFQSTAQTIVNPVNCVGVMGKGLALQFKQRFPNMYRDYLHRCAAGQVRLGEPYLYRLSTPWVMNFPTKHHWRDRSRLEDIERGLLHIKQHYREWGVQSIAFPALGCGLGGLSWSDVEPVILDILKDLDVEIELYAPTHIKRIEIKINEWKNIVR